MSHHSKAAHAQLQPVLRLLHHLQAQPHIGGLGLVGTGPLVEVQVLTALHEELGTMETPGLSQHLHGKLAQHDSWHCSLHQQDRPALINNNVTRTTQ